MNIVIFDDAGEPQLLLKESYFLNHWLWEFGKPDRFTAFLDLIFMAEENGTLTTSIRALSRRWNVSLSTTRKLLKVFKNHELIDYENMLSKGMSNGIRVTIHSDSLGIMKGNKQC